MLFCPVPSSLPVVLLLCSSLLSSRLLLSFPVLSSFVFAFPLLHYLLTFLLLCARVLSALLLLVLLLSSVLLLYLSGSVSLSFLLGRSGLFLSLGRSPALVCPWVLLAVPLGSPLRAPQGPFLSAAFGPPRVLSPLLYLWPSPSIWAPSILGWVVLGFANTLSG